MKNRGAGNTVQGNGGEKYCRGKGPEVRLSPGLNAFFHMSSSEAYSEDG